MRTFGLVFLIAAVTIVVAIELNPPTPNRAGSPQSAVSSPGRSSAPTPGAPSRNPSEDGREFDALAAVRAAGRSEPPPQSLELSYDPDSDLLTVRADEVALESLLESIATVTGIEVTFLDRTGLDQRVSVDFSRMALDKVVERLLRGFDKSFLHTPRDGPKHQPQLSRVIVAGLRRVTPKWPEFANRPGELAGARARRIADAVAKSDRREERDAATEVLISLLDESDRPTYDLAVRTLRELNPERAIDELEQRLEREAESGDDTREVSERRIVAAAGLGTLLEKTPLGEFPAETQETHRDEVAEEQPPPPNAANAIDALMKAFADYDPAARMAAAQSLARAGDPRANNFLLEAVSDDANMQKKVSAASALAFHGDPSVRDTLKHAIDQGTITGAGITQVVIVLNQEP